MPKYADGEISKHKFSDDRSASHKNDIVNGQNRPIIYFSERHNAYVLPGRAFEKSREVALKVALNISKIISR